jgi:hypothetical protein
MDTGGGSSPALFETLGQLRKSWIEGGWSWDDRFNCVATSFRSERARDAREIVRRFLPHEWTSTTVSGASAAVRDVADSTGGVRSNQRLYTGDAATDVLAYALWWPWGDGATISVRVGLAGGGLEADRVRLRQTFGAPE